MKPVLTIAVSTHGRRLDAVREWTFDPRVAYLLLWQQPGSQASAWPENVSLVCLPGQGVTRSRNAAIECCRTDWLWFMDDDVEVPTASIDALLHELRTRGADEVLIGSVVQPDGRVSSGLAEGRAYGRREILSVGTIQVIVNAPWVRGRGVRFPLRLGAGSPYPVCDEPVFLARALRAGARITQVGKVSVVHGAASSGQGLDRPELIRSRAIAFREIFGMPLCVLASTWFGLRHARAIGRHWPWLFRYAPAD